MIDIWINALRKPKETFASEKTKADLGKGIVNYVIAGLVSGVLGFIAATFLGGVQGGAGGAAFGAILGALGIVVLPIVTVIGSLIGIGIVFIVAKILGAKGTYTSLYYLGSLVSVPFAVLGILEYIPVLGALLGFLIGLYALYVEILAIQASQELSMGRAVLSIVIPIIVIAIIVAILVVLVGIAFLGALGAGLQNTGLAGLGV